MKIVVNGREVEVRDRLPLVELLRELSLDQRPIAIEVNLRVVPKDRFPLTWLAPGDRVEVVTLVGGG